MDDDFNKDRAILVRDLADKADPFTKKRLIDLAIRYEAGLPVKTGRSRSRRSTKRSASTAIRPRPNRETASAAPGGYAEAGSMFPAGGKPE